MTEKDNPSFYAVMEAGIRYDENISYFGRVLYAEINAMSNKDGYCHANNKYFEERFKVTHQTISATLTQLEKYGHIKITNRSGEGKRKIVPSRRKTAGEVQENLQHNTTSNNTTSISISKDIDETSTKLTLPVDGKSTIVRVVNLYSLLWQQKYGTRPTVDFGRAGKALKVLLAGRGEVLAGLLLMQYFHWKGTTGTDDFLNKRLTEATYPLYWFPEHADAILAFMRNVHKVKVDDENEVLAIVTKNIKEITG